MDIQRENRRFAASYQKNIACTATDEKEMKRYYNIYPLICMYIMHNRHALSSRERYVEFEADSNEWNMKQQH